MKTMIAKELYDKLEKDEVCLIDVREASEYSEAYIQKYHHIPLKELSLSKLPTQSKPIVFQCAAGVRSAKSCKLLLK